MTLMTDDQQHNFIFWWNKAIQSGKNIFDDGLCCKWVQPVIFEKSNFLKFHEKTADYTLNVDA